MEKFEKKQNIPVKERPTEEKLKKIEVPEKEWKILEIIAKRIGGDFGMKIKLGEPGGGSFFIPEDCSITFDPLHIRESPEIAKFVAGHEGAHRAITPGPKELGLTEEKIRELYSQIGFGYLQNVIEDPAVNDWMRERFPGLNEYVEKIYEKQFKEEGAISVTPEVKRLASQLGYWPRFAQYGSEVIRDWHQKRFSKKLDPAVKKALERTIKYVKESIKTVPDPQKSVQERREILEKAQQRFKINTNDIWPEVKKLVEMDFHTEEKRQMLKEFRQKQKELEQKRKELEQAQKEGDKEREGQLKKEIEGLERELDPFNQLPKEVRKELKKEIDKAIREAAERLNRKIKEKQEEIEKAQQRQQELEREIQELKEKVKSATGKEKEDLEKQIQEKKAEKKVQEMKQKQAEEELKDILKNIESEEEIPYPEDKLSEETKRALDELFKNLPSKKQKEMREKAKEKLEDFEDVINKEMEGKLNEDKPESHKERREREKVEREAAKRSEEARIERERIERKLEKMRREKMTPYERSRAEVVTLIDDLYYRLRRTLRPEEYDEEESGHPVGKYPDMQRVMQAKKDIKQKYKIWVKETALGLKDYRFWHLVDLSGSMRGEKIKETFKGFIVASEAIDRIEKLRSETLEIRQGITGFHNEIFPFKNPQEQFNKEVETRLATMPDRTTDSDAGTNTYSATLFTLEQLKQNLGRTANFLLTFSDGEPNYDIRDKLKKLLKEGKEEEREKLKIKVGLIWLGETGDEKMLQELVKEYNYDFGLVMPAVKPKRDKNFAESLADLLEDIVKRPEKY